MDPLAQIVTLLRPHTLLSKVVEGNGRWGVSYPAFEQPSFALVLEGQCWLTVEGDEPIVLSAGDFILFPATPGFALASGPDVTPIRMIVDANADADILHGDDTRAPAVRLLGGWFVFDQSSSPLLVDLLPRMIHIRADDPAIADIAAIVALIRRETATVKPGGALILSRLVEILLVEAIRSLPPDRATSGLLAGLRDRRLASVLGRIYANVAHPWTIDGMAQAAGMSRSAFSERFSRIVGQPPLTHLLRWRIAVAKDMLTYGARPVADVAFAVGYQSASAFSTAFTREVGQPPRDFIGSVPPTYAGLVE